jgi:cobalt-precorrin-5B (C1)-methyltransferase
VTQGTSLRRGWTTGACATAATRAAYVALVTGEFPDPVEIILPAGRRVSFALAMEKLGAGYATAGVIKDAGDDPDVTHGALITATLRKNAQSAGILFRAGPGVGTVTKPGLPIGIGEPAINPVPRRMMQDAIAQSSRELSGPPDVIVEISVADGEEIAKKTMNRRLGILGGLSILGTTGIVIPYSCSAWIASIHESIDVARALGLAHVAGSTGSTSETAVARYYGLSESALVEMGDFVGGMLKYLRTHPVPRVTIAGGFAKMCKLAQGCLDLHSARTTLDFRRLARVAEETGASIAIEAQIAEANTALEALQIATLHQLPITDKIAQQAKETALTILGSAPIAVDIFVVDREGTLLALS